jgi:hypothetical protein
MNKRPAVLPRYINYHGVWARVYAPFNSRESSAVFLIVSKNYVQQTSFEEIRQIIHSETCDQKPPKKFLDPKATFKRFMYSKSGKRKQKIPMFSRLPL